MTTSDERLRVLKMVEQGKISAEDGSRLLEALSAADRRRAQAANPSGPAASAGRWLRVRVTDAQTGRNKVNVTIPMGLVDVGLKMGARFAPEMEGFDLTHLAEMVRSGATGKLVEVQDREDGELVEIFVE
ncbi:MAG: hypothetical protein IAE85_18140 [Anaerolinea sp.]|nr:hypothetical protein [Anaerolinea sp.]